MAFKDLFSGTSLAYARFRPTYPEPLFDWLANAAPARELAVDIGAGNGQATAALATRFARVIAVDPSAAQLANAPADERVTYRQGSAEATTVEGGSADLVVAAQAFHWFAAEAFFIEARRIVRPGGVLAVWCYAVATVAPDVDALVHQLYEQVLGAYWEPERRLVETGYGTVRFPFPEVEVPSVEMRLTWTLEQLVGYLGTWSALQRYLRERGENPLEAMFPRLEAAWGGAPGREVRWPLAVRAFHPCR
jgi:SAM-dependent methyltransferase